MADQQAISPQIITVKSEPNSNGDGYAADEQPHSARQTARSNQQAPLSPANHTHKNKKLFPKKLWDLINDKRYNFCLRWSDDGQLVYLNRDEFEDSYLRTTENQFHTQKAISFVRQMNMYGFRKVDDCFYENDNFKRGCEHLLRNMIRKHPNKNPISGANNANITINSNELSPDLYRSLSETPPGAEEVDFNPSHYYNTGQSLLNHHQSSLNNSNCYNLSLRPDPTVNETSCDDFINNAQSQLINQHYQSSSPYADSNEFIRALISQSNHAHIPRDLTTNRNLSNIQPENNNLNAVYALLSSLNGNLYQAPPPPPPDPISPPSVHQTSFPFDINKLSNLQHIYQQILALQQKPIFDTPQQQQAEVRNHDTSTGHKPRSAKLIDKLALKDEDASSTSLLVKNRGTLIKVENDNGHELSNDDTKDKCQVSTERSENNYNNPSVCKSNQEFETRRRDTKSNRLFKRSVDSILDSNNNSPLDGAVVPKKMKTGLMEKARRHTDHESDKQVALGYAKELVTQVAFARDSRIDADVISEASKYTEQFVEILFDTIQVIARHSNNSSLATDSNSGIKDDCMIIDTDLVNDKDVEKSSINLNDLASALKLLPSKLSKILK